MKRLKKCCYCANTREGSLVVAVLGILLSIATIVAIWVAPISSVISLSSYFFEEEDKKYSNRNSRRGRRPHRSRPRRLLAQISKIILTINLCFTMLICGLLIVGIKKRRSWMMLPWVVLGLVLSIGLLISVLHTAIVLYRDDSASRPDAPLDKGPDTTVLATCVLVGGLLYLGLYLYLWLVVFSHYLDVRDEEERGRYSKNPYRR